MGSVPDLDDLTPEQKIALLSPEQKAHLKAWENANRAYKAGREQRLDHLAEMRKDSLMAAFGAKIPGTLLAEVAGCTHGRVYQLKREAEDERERLAEFAMRAEAEAAEA